MSDLGMILAWVAIQVALVGVPCLLVHALASRRGPSAGAWVAAVGLALIVALDVGGLVAATGPGGSPIERAAPRPPAGEPAARTSPRVEPGPAPGRDARGIALDLAALRRVWVRFGQGAVAPAERCRPWGGALTIAALAGTTISLLHLAAGIGAIRACRRRGRAVDDPGMLRTFAELLRAMGCHRRVDLREAADLDTPATAGWLRPVVFLPGGWRAWTEPERRAVIAHELGHVARGDYAVGLLARLAVALNTYHPLVRWIAGRLRLQQEQAADALAARFAGGREAYLVALARLALQQDGRAPSWPARAFLPTRGALIRRIEMLRNPNGSMGSDRPLTPWSRALAAGGLLAATVGVATLQGPARAADAPSAVEPAPAPASINAPIEPPYVPKGMDGVVVVRPAAISRRIGVGPANILLAEVVGGNVADLARRLDVDTARPGFLRIGWEDIEWVSCGVGFGRGGKNADGQELHSLLLSGLTVRAARAFDWPAFLRQWRLELVMTQGGARPYYKIEGPMKAELGRTPCAYLIDDRTIVFDEEAAIRPLAEGQAPPLPGYLRDREWERASQGLLAVALSNRDGALSQKLDLGRPDDAATLACLAGVDHWTLGVDDADSIGLRAVAACLGDDAGRQLIGTISPLLILARAAVDHPDPEAVASDADRQLNRLTGALLRNLGVEGSGREVRVRAEGFGTVAEFASIVAAMAEGEAEEAQARRAKAEVDRK